MRICNIVRFVGVFLSLLIYAYLAIDNIKIYMHHRSYVFVTVKSTSYDVKYNKDLYFLLHDSYSSYSIEIIYFVFTKKESTPFGILRARRPAYFVSSPAFLLRILLKFSWHINFIHVIQCTEFF